MVTEDTELKSLSKHDIVGNVLSSLDIIWEFKEKRLEESLPSHSIGLQTSQEEVGVVVSYERILVFDSLLHDVHVRHASFVDFSELPGLLGYLPYCIVVSREWVVGTNNVPSSAELRGGVA